MGAQGQQEREFGVEHGEHGEHLQGDESLLAPGFLGDWWIDTLAPERVPPRLVASLLRRGARSPALRAPVADALAAATSHDGRRLPAHALAWLRMRLIDEIVSCDGPIGGRPIDRLLLERAAWLEQAPANAVAAGEGRVSVAAIAAAYDALAVAATLPARAYEVVSSPNDGRAWLSPLGGGGREIVDLRGVPGVRRGGLVVGRLVPWTSMPAAERDEAPTRSVRRGKAARKPARPAAVRAPSFVGGAMAFAPDDAAVALDTIAMAGAHVDDVRAARAALFGVLVRAELRRDAAELKAEWASLPGGGMIFDHHAAKALFACADVDEFAERVVESGCVESADDSGFLVHFRGGRGAAAGDGDSAAGSSAMGEVYIDEGGFWLCASDYDELDEVRCGLEAAMAAAPGGPRFVPVPLAPIDEDGEVAMPS